MKDKDFQEMLYFQGHFILTEQLYKKFYFRTTSLRG